MPLRHWHARGHRTRITPAAATSDCMPVHVVASHDIASISPLDAQCKIHSSMRLERSRFAAGASAVAAPTTLSRTCAAHHL